MRYQMYLKKHFGGQEYSSTHIATVSSEESSPKQVIMSRLSESKLAVSIDV